LHATVLRIWAPTTITGMSMPVDEWFTIVFPRQATMSAPQTPQQPGRPVKWPPPQQPPQPAPAQPAPQTPPPSAPTPAAPRQERPDPFAEEVQ
jgi:hypothetical protein